MSTSFLHYDIVKKLGEGGMGIVYLARDRKLIREVALKFLPRHISLDRDERERFRQEAQAAAGLNHPHIAQVYAIEELDDEQFIVMEYVEGVELKDAIEEDSLTPEQKWTIAEQVARGLKAAHDKGVIHRDIKSRNIMLDHEGRAKIMDFGLARVQGSAQITKTGTTIGTTAYMSPEQLSTHNVDVRSDIWSYGVVLYELFTGELPFQGVYEPAVMYAIVEEEPQPASKVAGNVPQQIEHVIHRCLVKDRDSRYQDFSEVIGGLTAGSGTGKSTRPAVGSTPSRNGSFSLYFGIPAILLILLTLVLLLSSNLNLPGLTNRVPEKRYLAILPIENIGNNPYLQAICDGLAETMSYRLSELEQYEDSFWVTPASEMRREQIRSATQANRLFGVNLAVLSSIQTMNDSTRLILELVDADNIQRLGTKQVVVPSNNLAALERNGVRAMLQMLQIEINPRINATLNQGEPSQPEAYAFYLKGLASLQDNNNLDSLNHAIGLFEQAIDMDPEFALAYAGLGETHWQKYETTREVPYLEEARSALNRALRLNPNLAPVQVLLGRLNAGTGALEEAVTYFTRALEIDPKYSPAYRGLANVYDEQGDAAKAVATYRKAISLKPDYWEGYKDLGIHYLGRGAFDNAIEQFRQVVRNTPKNSTAYSNLGVAYYYSGDNAMARRMFENSLALDRNPLTANNLAGIYYMDGMYEEAAGMYELALESYTNRYEIWGNLAGAYEWSGQKEQARETYLIAIEKAQEQLRVNPNDAEVMADLGAYYSDVDDTVKSIEFIQKAMALNSEDIRLRQRIVAAYERLGMRAEALRWIKPSMITEIESQPEFRALIADPAYSELKQRLIPVQQN